MSIILSSDDENSIVLEEIENMKKNYQNLQKEFKNYKIANKEEMNRLQNEIRSRDKQIQILQSQDESMKVKGLVSELRIKQNELEDSIHRENKLKAALEGSSAKLVTVEQELRSSSCFNSKKQILDEISCLESKNLELMQAGIKYKKTLKDLEEEKTQDALMSMDSLQKDNIRLQDQLDQKEVKLQELDSKNENLNLQIKEIREECKPTFNQ